MRPATAEHHLSHAPSVLGLTASEYIDAAAQHARVTRGRALDQYRLVFREGRLDASQLQAGLGAITRQLTEESPEGPVIKFTQEIPAAPRLADCRGKPPPDEVTARFGTLQTESVLIPMLGRKGQRNYTLCVSSQVGCAMGCVFCETAQMGLIRHLTAPEIVGQWYAATHLLKTPVRNIVFMGMGEPLDNLDHVLQAIAVLKEHNGASVPISKITVSTVGRLDGLEVLRERLHHTGWHRLNLAVSLNAPSNAVRSEIMPVNRAMPMERLQAMLADWPIYGGGKICLEYVLIPGVNDTEANAAQVAAFVAPIDARYREVTGVETPRVMVNLIPYNPRRDSPWPAPDEADVDRFLSQLTAAGAYAKRRRTKGRQMMGACGQLGSEHIRRRRFVGISISGEQ